MFSVDYWCSHPDANNDDCSIGWDFDNEVEARAKFNEAPSKYGESTAYIVLTKPDGREVRDNPGFKPNRDLDNGDWVRESRMQHAMAFGCID